VTAKEYALLAANARELWLRALISCAYNFGFRKSELLNLRLAQVDLLGKWIELRGGETKNGRGRKLKMTAEVFELMRACVAGKKPDDYVFTRKDGSPVHDPRKAWYDLCVRTDLGEITPANGKKYKFNRFVGLNLHDFRRSAVRNLVRAGVPERVAMEISGHKTRSVFDRYNIVDERDLVRASELIEAGSGMAEPSAETDTKTDTQPHQGSVSH